MLPPAGASGAARLSAFHHGSGLGDRTPLPGFSTALPELVPFKRALPANRPATVQRCFSRTGRNAGRAARPEAARERVVNPRAGAVPAPPYGIPSGRRPLVSGQGLCNRIRDECQGGVPAIVTPNFRVLSQFDYGASNVSRRLLPPKIKRTIPKIIPGSFSISFQRLGAQFPFGASP